MKNRDASNALVCWLAKRPIVVMSFSNEDYLCYSICIRL